MKSLVFLLLSVITYSTLGHEIKDMKLPLFAMKIGRCPLVETMDNFNMTAIEGRWYQVYKSPSVLTLGTKCVREDIHAHTDGSLFSEMKVYSKIAHKYIPFEAEFWQPKGVPSGIMLGEAKGTNIFSGVYMLQVICTDYDNYFIMYMCVEAAEGLVHYDFVNVMSRKPELPKETKEKLKTKLLEKGFDVSQLLKVDQFACPRDESVDHDYVWKMEDPTIFEILEEEAANEV